jgi:hypothetical protein
MVSRIVIGMKIRVFQQYRGRAAVRDEPQSCEDASEDDLADEERAAGMKLASRAAQDGRRGSN